MRPWKTFSNSCTSTEFRRIFLFSVRHIPESSLPGAVCPCAALPGPVSRIMRSLPLLRSEGGQDLCSAKSSSMRRTATEVEYCIRSIRSASYHIDKNRPRNIWARRLLPPQETKLRGDPPPLRRGGFFRPLPDGCAERCNTVRRHVGCRPLRNKKRGRRLTRPSHRLGDRIPPFRIPYRQDCGHRTRPARTIPGGDSRRPMYPVEIIS